MTFVCPGCHQTHPLQEGQLVWEATSAIPPKIARMGVAAIEARERGTAIMILCAPCTAEIVLARAGLR